MQDKSDKAGYVQSTGKAELGKNAENRSLKGKTALG